MDLPLSRRCKMDIFLDDMCQVNFPGDVIYGVLCTHGFSNLDQEKLVIEAIGCTFMWKSGTKEEIDVSSTFYTDQAQLRSEVDNSNVSLNDKYRDYSKIFMFYLVLPNNLPPSHEVPFGCTRYTLRAYYNDQKVSTFFSINQWVGLEKRNDAVVKRSSFPISLFSCGQYVQIVLNLKETYYLPGEIIKVGAIIRNNSWRAVLFSQIHLIQTTKYWKSHHLLPIKYDRIIKEEKRGYIPSGEEQIWNDHQFHIPAVIPTTSTSNNSFNYFKVTYTIKVIITMINLKKICLKQKLFIGNWDKSTDINRQQCLEILKNNDPSYVITTEETIPEKNIDFTPKYIIYETNNL